MKNEFSNRNSTNNRYMTRVCDGNATRGWRKKWAKQVRQIETRLFKKYLRELDTVVS